MFDLMREIEKQLFKAEPLPVSEATLAPGFYWVQLDNSSEWEIARWTGTAWLATGCDHHFGFKTFDNIGARVQQ